MATPTQSDVPFEYKQVNKGRLPFKRSLPFSFIFQNHLELLQYHLHLMDFLGRYVAKFRQ